MSAKPGPSVSASSRVLPKCRPPRRRPGVSQDPSLITQESGPGAPFLVPPLLPSAQAGAYVEMGFLLPYLAPVVLPSGPHPGPPIGRKFLVLICTATVVCHLPLRAAEMETLKRSPGLSQ